MISEKQIRANQLNAQKSSGPRTPEGKCKVSNNRITHGILSGKLLLTGENPHDYQALLDELQAQLRPVGALELSLVEKIAVILWRQRRLVRAETATIELALNPHRIANEVTSGLGLSGFGGEKIEPEDFHPVDQEQSDHLDWCKAMIEQYNAAESLSLVNLNKAAPLIYAQLAEDAEAEQESIPEHLDHIGLEEYIGELVRWCHKEVANLEQKVARQPALVALAEKARDKLVIPWQKLDVLTKYQTTLDNQLYKAMKALRDEQTWRLNSLEAIEPPIEEAPVDAA